VLGGGGFGITYLAHDTHLDCRVAIKEYAPATWSPGAGFSLVPRSPDVSRRFERGLQRFLLESRALASFHNPGIVRVLRYFRANETAYMVMDYETGQPLQRWLVGRLPLDKTMLLRIVRPLLDGLEVVHGTGFLHRDIKPENIYIRADGSPVLLDFGSARRVEADGSDQALTAVLTPASPRPSSTTATASRGHGPIYALAGVMYWMVTGNRPMEAFARLREDTMPAAAEIGNKDVFDIELLRAIDWALKPDEDDRPRRVADFRRACLGGPVGEVAPPEPPALEPLPLGLSAYEARAFIGAVLFADVATPADKGASRSRPGAAGPPAAAGAGPCLAHRASGGEYQGRLRRLLRGRPRRRPACRGAAGRDRRRRRPGRAYGHQPGPGAGGPDPGPDGRSRILGDGITIAFRIMRFSEPGQVLAGRSYVEVMQNLGRSVGERFRYLGVHRDPQARNHELYLYSGESITTGLRGPDTVDRGDAPLPGIDAAAVEHAERVLAQHIGPMARLLVRRTVPRAANLFDLHRRLGALIPESEPRTAFLSAVVTMDSRPLPGTTEMRTDLAANRSGPATTAPGMIPDADLARMEKLFARYIGPMAKVLVRRESRNANSLDTLCRALASHIDKDADRRRFMAEAGF
jgi:serine/threonine protein kinase